MTIARARTFCLVGLFIFAPLRLHAVIGDDLAALRARYGSAKAVGNQMLFLHKGFSIAVYFDGAHSAMEIFVRDETHGNPTDFTQRDVDAILALEGEGKTWNEVQTRSGQPTWLRADDKLIARFNPTERVLTVMENSR